MVQQLGKGLAIPINLHHTPTILQPSSSQPQKTQKPKKPTRKDTQVPQPSGPTESVTDEVVYNDLGDSLVRASTTASSLEAEQDSGNITKTQSKATPNEPSSLGTDSDGGPKCQEIIRDTIAQTRFGRVSKQSNDSLLARGNTLQSDEDRLKLDELMALCTTSQNKVLDLEKTKTTQFNEIASLKRRVKKLEKRNRLRTHGLKRLYKVGLSARVESSRDEESLVDAAQVSTATTTVTITTEEITLAQALKALKTSKPKDKGKGIMMEELVKPKKKDQIRLDEEVAKKLQAEFDKKERLTREKAKKEERANISLIETWDDIQAKIDVDHQLAERLQAQEQEELSNLEKATLFQQLLEKRRKHFAAKRVEEKRNKPPKKAQQRKIMCTCLKNMEGYKLKDLKLKEVNSIQEMFNKAVKRLMETIPAKEEVAIDAILLAVKSPRIVDWKIHKEGKKSYYQIVKPDEKSQMYMIFSRMLKIFDKEDLEDVYKLVKARYGSTRLVKSMDYLLWSDMKIMFEPHVEDKVWKMQQGYKVLEWKLYDSCGVHSLMMQSIQIYML
nr:hypothetical protein [Tanacetum cinerariifolium]